VTLIDIMPRLLNCKLLRGKSRDRNYKVTSKSCFLFEKVNDAKLI